MLSLYVNPLAFDNKKNEVLQSEYKIEWKKQVATVSIKKGLSPIEFLNQKINNKLVDNKSNISDSSNIPEVFAYFDYNTEEDKNKQIFLVNINKSKVFTELYYKSHIPQKENINIVIKNPKIVKQNKDYLKITGEVIAFCLDINTYYLENININEYIDIVQNSNTEDTDDDEIYDEHSDVEADGTDNEECDPDEADDVDDDGDGAECNGDDDVEDDGENDEEDDGENDEEDDGEDDGENDEEDDGENDEEDDGAECDVEDDGEDDGEDNVEDDDDEIDMDEDEADGFDIADEEGDYVEAIPEVEQSTRKKKSNSNKNIKLSNNIDLSIIFNILKEEDKNTIIPENQLFSKRQTGLQILKTLASPLKTVQMIEKGVYNYAIDKCNNKSFIPLWDNMEFVEIYVSKIKNIYSNLKTNSYVKNVNLINKIKTEQIKPYNLAFLDTHKLFPEIWTDIIEEKTKIEKILKDSLKESATDMFECPKCHKRKTIYCEVQTRSSDEPMTKFITCLECGCKWKKY